MISLDLTADERQDFYDALIDSHRIRISVKVLNRNEKEVGALTAPIHKVLSGAIQVDATAAVTRSLSLVVLDPNRKLRFEANTPAHGALYADRFIAVTYEVWVEALGRWVSIPVFWGPLSNYSRSGSEVTIEAQGKEALLLDPHLVTRGYTIYRKTRLDDAIRKIARKATGEEKFKIPDINEKLGRSRVLHQGVEPWLAITNSKSTPGFVSRSLVGGVVGAGGKIVKDIAIGRPPGLVDTIPGNFTAFYNGHGQLHVRRLNRHSVWTFHRNLYLTSRPEISFDIMAFRNYVIVHGGKPKGHKNRANGHATLKARNPMSPERLGREGTPRYMVHIQEADNLKTDAKCKQQAEKILDRMSKQGVEISFQTLPVPMLEENDIVTLDTNEYSIDFQVRQFTIPLSSDEPMTIGRHEKVKVRKRRRSHHPPRHHGHHHGGPHHHHGGHHIDFQIRQHHHHGQGHHGHYGHHFHPHAEGHGHHRGHQPGYHDPGRGGHPGGSGGVGSHGPGKHHPHAEGKHHGPDWRDRHGHHHHH